MRAMYCICVLGLVLLPGLAQGQVNARLVLDRTRIPACGALSGSIELVANRDLVLDAPLGFLVNIDKEAYSVKVDCPSGRELLVTGARAMGGLHVDWMAPPNEPAVMLEGQTFVVPIFMLKIDKEFLFTEIGVHSVELDMEKLPGRPVLTCKVEVYDCAGCDRDEYTALFGDRTVMSPFNGIGAPRISKTFSAGHVYFDSLIRTAIYQEGAGLLSGAYLSSGGDQLMTRRYFALGKHLLAIDRGLRWSREVNVDCDIWSCMNRRAQMLAAGQKYASEAVRDKKGRILILPR